VASPSEKSSLKGSEAERGLTICLTAFSVAEVKQPGSQVRLNGSVPVLPGEGVKPWSAAKAPEDKQAAPKMADKKTFALIKNNMIMIKNQVGEGAELNKRAYSKE